MTQTQSLIQAVSVPRQAFITVASGLTYQQAKFKPSAESWSVIDNVEHMYWAEFGGICGVWRVIENRINDQPANFTDELIHQGLPIESIIERTWREKEEVPETAKPQ